MLAFSWFHHKKEYFFAKTFLKKGQIWHARTHIVPIFPTRVTAGVQYSLEMDLSSWLIINGCCFW